MVVLCWLCVQEHLGGPDLLNVTRMFDSMNDLQHAFNNATVEWKERLDAERAREANTTNRTHRRYHLKKWVVDKSFLFPTSNNTPNKSKQTNKSKLRLAGRAQRAAHPSRSEHYKHSQSTLIGGSAQRAAAHLSTCPRSEQYKHSKIQTAL